MVTRSRRQAATGFFADFRDFIMRGNVVDLAVAVIIGGAFGKIIDSFIADIVTPIILNPALKAANVEDLASLSVNGIKYGVFLSAILSFLVIAFTIFLMVRAFENLKKRTIREEELAVTEEAALEPAVSAQEELTNAIIRLTQVIESQTPLN